jgi:hypothetical protein
MLNVSAMKSEIAKCMYKIGVVISRNVDDSGNTVHLSSCVKEGFKTALVFECNDIACHQMPK